MSSGLSAPAPASWTWVFTGPVAAQHGSASSTPTDAECSPVTSPESLSTTTSPNSTRPSSNPWTSSLEAPPAQIGQSLEIVPDSAVSEPTSTGISSASETRSSPSGQSGKTSPASSASTRARTSLASWAPSWAPPSLFPPQDGLAQVWQAAPEALRLGGCSTLNGSECPNAAAACSLSQILEASAPTRFYLSAKAARGILRRAEKRGRKLPTALESALRALSGLTEAAAPTPRTLSEGGGLHQIAGTLDKAGGGGVDDNDARAGHLVIAAPLTAGGHPGSHAPGRRREDDFNIVVEIERETCRTRTAKRGSS